MTSLFFLHAGLDHHSRDRRKMTHCKILLALATLLVPAAIAAPGASRRPEVPRPAEPTPQTRRRQLSRGEGATVTAASGAPSSRVVAIGQALRGAAGRRLSAKQIKHMNN